MALLASQIVATYPKIKDDVDIATYIELARLQTSSSYYGTKYELAVALRAAHNLTLAKPEIYGRSSNLQGAPASRRQQDLSEAFYNSTPQFAGGGVSAGLKLLATTTYGQQLLQLMTMSNTSMSVIGASSLAVSGSE